MVAAIKVYVVEDVAISRMSLETMLIENNYELSGSAAKAEIAWEELQQSATDLILLDINLAGEKNGVWLAQKVRKYLNIPIVFLTAYGDQQTLKEVLKTKPNGYLMKPYQEATLLTTINIALTSFLEQQPKENSRLSESETKEFLFIKEKNIRVKLIIPDIYFIKSEGNYLEIKLENKTYVVRSKLSEFLKSLPNHQFFQCHMRYVVNIKKIDLLGKDFVNIHNFDIPLAGKYRTEIEKELSII